MQSSGHIGNVVFSITYFGRKLISRKSVKSSDMFSEERPRNGRRAPDPAGYVKFSDKGRLRILARRAAAGLLSRQAK
jgi:hypothetical protein